jgi:hypothetical protein
MIFSISARVSSKTPISAWDAVEVWYGSRDDSRDDIEKVMY